MLRRVHTSIINNVWLCTQSLAQLMIKILHEMKENGEIKNYYLCLSLIYVYKDIFKKTVNRIHIAKNVVILTFDQQNTFLEEYLYNLNRKNNGLKQLLFDSNKNLPTSWNAIIINNIIICCTLGHHTFQVIHNVIFHLGALIQFMDTSNFRNLATIHQSVMKISHLFIK